MIEWVIVWQHLLGNPSIATKEPTFKTKVECIERVRVLNAREHGLWRYVCEESSHVR